MRSGEHDNQASGMTANLGGFAAPQAAIKHQKPMSATALETAQAPAADHLDRPWLSVAC
jgi:hypothetical protein